VARLGGHRFGGLVPSAPALSGLPPDSAPPLHWQQDFSKKETVELAALPRGCLGVSWSMTPNLRTPSEARRSRPRRPKAAASTGGTGSAGKPGGQAPQTNRWGALGGVSNTRPIVPASLRAIEHASRTASAP